VNAASFSDFIYMGGYGLYVWGSLGMCGAVMAAELMLLRVRRAALLKEAADPSSAGTEEHTA
jgi:heme exporter protein D